MKGWRIPKYALVMRWIARIWSILIFTVVLLMFIFPDQNLVQPVPLTDWVRLGIFPGLAVIGLLLAWLYEIWGGILVIFSFLAHLTASYLWLGMVVPLGGNLILAFVFLIPGILFILSGTFSRRRVPSKRDKP